MFKEISGATFSGLQLEGFLNEVRCNYLKCKNTMVVNGDRRFWGVDSSRYEFIAKFEKLAVDTYRDEVGASPKHVIIMVNHITAERSPEGSGGGWHVDSVRNQYKMFMYLTDCKNESHGPLTLYSSGNGFVDKVVIFFNYIVGNKFRFSSKFIKRLRFFGFQARPVLRGKNLPFFLNTSYIHRGAKIREGERILLTAYIFEKDIPNSIRERVSG